MVTVFHLSDLHIVTSGNWNIMRNCILDEARELAGEKLLVVTGDFHNFSEGGCTKAEVFLKELISALGIEPDKDVFVVPGNHDVGSEKAIKRAFRAKDGWRTDEEADESWSDWKDVQDATVNWLKEHSSADPDYQNRVKKRLKAYAPYCTFARRLGVYPANAELTSAGVHVRCWRGRLNLLHLNTTLIADGTSKTGQRLDILSATSPAIWSDMNESLPALALGHNSYFDLDERQQNALRYPFGGHGVCAYLCGDTHAEETDANRQHLRLDYGYTTKPDEIPNVVCVKGAADDNDKFSDFGLYLHEWDEQASYVKLRLLRWTPERGFQSEDSGGYTMPHQSPDDTRRELERLREELKKRDGAPPPETDREQEARALWSEGKTDEALARLSEDRRKERMSESVRQYIRESLLKIDILKSKGLNRETIPKIRACYEECAALAKTHRVSVYVLYDYASFLEDLNDYPPAIETARWLLDYYQQENESEENQARLQNLLGNLLFDTNGMDEAEMFYREALTIRRRLAEANPAAFEPKVALTCNNLAVLLKNTNRMDEAESLYREALTIRRQLAEANPAAFEPKVALTCNNLAVLLKNTNRMDEAESLYREALAIRRQLAKENPFAYEPDVAQTINNLAVLLKNTNRMDEAESLYREALAIRRRLAEANPAAYEPYVARTCNNLANLLSDDNRKDEAEKFYREALTIRRRLAEMNPAAYEPDVATTCYNLGLLLRDTSRKAVAKPLFEEAARLWDKYPHFSGDAQDARFILNIFFR